MLSATEALRMRDIYAVLPTIGTVQLVLYRSQPCTSGESSRTTRNKLKTHLEIWQTTVANREHNKADYQFKYWLESETPEKLKNSFKELAQVLNIKSDNINKVVNDFYKTIAAIPTILVFDNVEKPADVYAYLPTRVDLPPGVSIHVLITSRDVLQHANERVSAVVNYCKESPSPRILEYLVKYKAITAMEAVLKLISKNHIQIAMKEHDLLYHAIENGDLNITRLLCKYGADINPPVSFMGHLPLHHALKTRNMEIATWLLENGAAPTVQDGSGPARGVCAAAVTLIHQLNKHLIDIKNESGEAALHVIPYDDRCMDDDRILSTIRVLIESGVDLTNVDIWGNTVLHSAARGNDFNITFKHLLKDVLISYTLRKVYFTRMKDTARVLLMNGLSLHIRDNKGCTPIVTVHPEFKDILVQAADECNNQLHE
ncbi:pyrexia [Carabus blaptoides fortunei]